MTSRSLLGAQVVAENLDRFDERGRAMYGDAWDEGMDNGLPLRYAACAHLVLRQWQPMTIEPGTTLAGRCF